MKIIYTFTLLLFSGLLIAQQNADEILASNDINSEKTTHTLLASQFQTMEASALDGVYKLLAENGELKEVRSFEQGKLDGTWLQYGDHQNLIAIANYKDDQKHGKWTIWDENGTKRYELFYLEGKRTGTWKSWDEKGELLSTKDY